MFQRSLRRCAAAAVAASSATTDDMLAPFADRVGTLCQRMQAAGAEFGCVAVNPDEEQCRGLVAKCAIREGTTVMSIPLQHCSISCEQLKKDEFVQTMQPPSLDVVRHIMSTRSIRDPVMYEQLYLALLISADHMNPASPRGEYYNLLPHPAVDDALAIQRHKDVLDPLLLVEWNDYQKEMLSILHHLLRRWDSPRAPPIQVAYWALRTVFSRMHMMPKAGLAPQQVGSTLSYTALSTVDRADLQTRWSRRLKTILSSLMGSPADAEEYQLVPTLVPLLDMTPHIPSSNVQVEVSTRNARVGGCAELRAVRDIEAGETIGLRFNSSQAPAFLLFRFGFIPQ